MTDHEINPDNHLIDTATTEVSDIDLDEEEFFYQGQRLTEDDAERIADETLKTIRGGRPSLTGERRHSPQVAFQLTPELRAEAEAQAAREGRRVANRFFCCAHCANTATGEQAMVDRT